MTLSPFSSLPLYAVVPSLASAGVWLGQALDGSDPARVRQDLYTLDQSFSSLKLDDWRQRSSSLLRLFEAEAAKRLFADVRATEAVVASLDLFFSEQKAKVEKWRRQTEFLEDPEAARRAVQPNGPDDVAWRIEELPVECRETFQRWLNQVRVLKPVTRMPGVSERVLFEFARTGDILRALGSEIPFEEVEAHLRRLAEEVPNFDPLGPASARDEALSLKTGLEGRLESALQTRRMTYREFERMNVEAVYLADVSQPAPYNGLSHAPLRRKAVEEWTQEHCDDPAGVKCVLTTAGMQRTEMHRFLVPVYTTGALDEIEVHVPGAGNYPVEVVFEPTFADGAKKRVWNYMIEHDRRDHYGIVLTSLEKARAAIPGPWKGGGFSLTPEQGMGLMAEILGRYTIPVLRVAARDPEWWAIAGHVLRDVHHSSASDVPLPATFYETIQASARCYKDDEGVAGGAVYAAFARALEEAFTEEELRG